MCVLILLHVCPHTTRYVSSHHYICVFQHQTMREIARVLQINERVATSLGTPYMHQLSCIYERMLQARLFFFSK